MVQDIIIIYNIMALFYLVFRFKNLKRKSCLFNYSQMTICSCVYDISVIFMLLMFISYTF